jgi:hypothetical protein
MPSAVFLNSIQVESLTVAVSRANPHDEIQIEGLIDLTDSLHIDIPLTFTGLGPNAVITVHRLMRSGKGCFCTNEDTVIKYLTFQGATALTGNGAGVWHERGSLMLENCRFIGNQNGVMVGGSADAIGIAGCEFISNGSGCGHTHGVYISAAKTVQVEQCRFHDTNVGHHLKSRAAATTVLRCYFGGSPQGTTSCAIDMANGGFALIAQNQFVKGGQSLSSKFISYCAEGNRLAHAKMSVISNIFISHRGILSVAVANYSYATSVNMVGNAYERVRFGLVGRGKQYGKLNAQVAIATGAWRDPIESTIFRY